MRKEHLVPTPIVDKNGKQTTVHKRLPQPSSTLGLPLALPNLVASNYIDRLDGEPGSSADLLKQELINQGVSNKEIGEMLNALHPDTLSTLDDILNDWEHGTFVVKQSFVMSVEARSLAQTNNIALFYDKSLGKPYQNQMFHTYVNGLRAHDYEYADGARDYTLSSEPEKDAARALLKATLEINVNFTTTADTGVELWTYMPSKALCDFIKERPQDADKIISLINERPETQLSTPEQVDHLRALVDQDVATPLSQGII